MKEGGNTKTWKDRYLVIETEKLSYYTSETRKKETRRNMAQRYNRCQNY